MALIGYFVKYLGGSWGGLLRIGFLAAGGVLLFTLLFSGTLRSRLRVFLSKHFFSYRYDYRVEWLRFTQGLAALSDVPAGVTRTMASLTTSPGGMLIHRDANGELNELTTWELNRPDYKNLGNLPEWILQSGWVIDLFEWRDSPDIYQGLNLPDWISSDHSLWLVIPLLFQDELEAVLLLSRTDLKHSVNWEDRDLLKTAGRQASALLAQHRASQALVEARQFDAFNRLSAYVIHDLKNILAQQSLIVSNARKHRDNPEFIDDMISTVDNSVKRMQRLMDQMRSGLRSIDPAAVHLDRLLAQVVETRAVMQPVPQLDAAIAVSVIADRERLSTVFSHLVQNAQEATPDDGAVKIQLTTSESTVKVCISDSGSGMSEDFVRERLFKPFESTKGLTGMGIGAFESREYVRQLGGDISVTSEPGLGSCFSITLPIADGVENTRSDSESCEPDTSARLNGVAH
jgi:putative PEP-CTERM system histidine kinase